MPRILSTAFSIMSGFTSQLFFKKGARLVRCRAPDIAYFSKSAN